MGLKERRSGEGRRALGEKAFSSDPRGSLGVPDPPAAAPPECAVATVATARARGRRRLPPPALRGRGGMGAPAPRWGRVAAPCLPRPAPPPSELGEGPAGPRWACPVSGGGSRCACAVRARGRPPWCEPRGKEGEGEARRPVGRALASPSPRSRGEEEPVYRARPRLRAAAGGGVRSRSGPPRSRACPRDVEPRGQTRWEADPSRTDGWMDGGRWAGDGAPALAAGPGRGARSAGGGGWPASRASRDRPRVWVAVGSRAGFPGGPAASPVFSGSPGGTRAPAPRPLPCVLAGPSPPLPVFPPRPARAAARAPSPCPGPSRPRLTWVSSPGVRRPVASPGGAVPSGPCGRGGGEPWLHRQAGLRA